MKVPMCTEHDVPMEWLDGSPIPGYVSTFRPIGWCCTVDYGHAFIGRDIGSAHRQWFTTKKES